MHAVVYLSIQQQNITRFKQYKWIILYTLNKLNSNSIQELHIVLKYCIQREFDPIYVPLPLSL